MGRLFVYKDSVYVQAHLYRAAHLYPTPRKNQKKEVNHCQSVFKYYLRNSWGYKKPHSQSCTMQHKYKKHKTLQYENFKN